MFRYVNLTWKIAKKRRKASIIRAAMYEKAAKVNAIVRVSETQNQLELIILSVASQQFSLTAP